jgi:parallel beta-helix repeat protein
MKPRLAIPVLAVLAALVFAAAPAFAVVRVVPTAAFPTIQSAEDASAPGDVIRILNGVYHENVVVDVANLQIIGHSTTGVVVDAFAGGGHGILVTSDGVTITALTVRHALEDGIHVEGANFTLRSVTVINSADNDLHVLADNARILFSTFIGAEASAGVLVQGNNAEIRGNRARNQGEGGFWVEGDDNLLLLNEARNIEDGGGFAVVGHNNTLQLNKAFDTDFGAFLVLGDDNLVDRNAAQGSHGPLFVIVGANPRVLGNRGSQTAFDVFGIGCEPVFAAVTVDCTKMVVRGNHASDAVDDEEGFDVFVDAAGGAGWIVEQNTAWRNNSHGFTITGSGGIIRNNVAIANGTETEHGFTIHGDDNSITGNRSTDNEGDGLIVGGNGNLIRANRADRNKLDGIHVVAPADGNTVDRNVAFGNHADGIRNDGTGTILTNNTSRANRVDCTSDLAGGASVATDTRNACVDGSSFSVTQTDGV